ncbi:HNH endonuclease signature motif containing protein [Actinomycetospora callitridis]|uniref:HNH endonuclease signature motif containing protein n=1 Tax=Actinomycetospora callitridis TaxID=913944 RepID=UPI002366BB1B|nr:HNH endonuclease signature motif containing protein [Actinomycetospora callitridis]MDD7921101.1 DUF222 domain-containing protein [Actinomycetospora callitridis]
MSIDHGVRVGLVAELDALAPGAELAAALECLSPAALTGEDLAAYVRGRWRSQNRATAELLEGIHHLGRAQAGRTERLSSCDEFSGDEVSAQLGWSRTMSSRKLDLADDLQQRLPEVGNALYGGWLDEPKARTICDQTRDLTDDHAHEVCRIVLPEAPELPVGALIERIEQVATALDPDWAQRRRQRAEARARVLLSPTPSGTANLSFCDAPAPDGIASQARIDALAATVRHLGVLTPIGVLRLQVGLRLLDGSTAGMDDRTIALLLAAEYHAQNTPQDPDDASGGDDTGDDGPDDSGPDDNGPDDDGPGEDPGEDPDDDLVATVPAPRSPSEQGVLDLPDLPAVLDPAVPLDPPDTGPGRIREGCVEVRLRLTTALGLDEHPGSVPGYGAVLAGDARTLALRHRSGEWRVVLTDDQGRLQHVLLARRRPPDPRRPARARGRRASIVELHVPTTLLAALDPDDHPDWAPLLRELQQRLADLGRPGAPPDHNAGPDDRARRRPGAELDRWIRVRDRHCVAPWCRRPAHNADLDHTLAHARGGPTSSWNLGAWCTHDHRAKHHAPWTVRQPSPGQFVIRTRAGITYTSHPKRVTEPLPAPRPAAAPRPLPDDGWSDDRTDAGDDIDPDWYRKVAPTQKARPTRTTTPIRSSYDGDPPF